MTIFYFSSKLFVHVLNMHKIFPLKKIRFQVDAHSIYAHINILIIIKQVYQSRGPMIIFGGCGTSACIVLVSLNSLSNRICDLGLMLGERALDTTQQIRVTSDMISKYCLPISLCFQMCCQSSIQLIKHESCPLYIVRGR